MKLNKQKVARELMKIAKMLKAENLDNYAIVDDILEELVDSVDGITYGSNSDATQSGTVFTLSLGLKVLETEFVSRRSGFKKPSVFKADFKDIARGIKKVLKDNHVELYGKIYIPKKKYWKTEWNEKRSYYDGETISFDISFN